MSADERCADCRNIIAESFGKTAYMCTRCGIEPLCFECHQLCDDIHCHSEPEPEEELPF